MADEILFDPHGPALLVGGYGTVGAEVARMAAAALPLVLTGRSVSKGRQLAQETGAELRAWDLAHPKGFESTARVVVSLVNDPHDRVLRAALRGGVPYVDITRWTARMQRAATVVAMQGASAPVLLSSAWMGGVVSLVVAHLADELGGADSVDVAIRWDLDDRAGADSVEFMDRLGFDFEIVEQGEYRMVEPLSSVSAVSIGDLMTKVARIDTPEQFTLPLVFGVGAARTRIGFGSPVTTSALIAAKKAGVFRWGRGDRFTAMRRAFLYSPGDGGTARVRVDVTRGGRTRTGLIVDRAGQAHLTGVGAMLGVKRVLGMDGGTVAPGMTFPEMTPVPEKVPAMLAEHGVELLIDHG